MGDLLLLDARGKKWGNGLAARVCVGKVRWVFRTDCCTAVLGGEAWLFYVAMIAGCFLRGLIGGKINWSARSSEKCFFKDRVVR